VARVAGEHPEVFWWVPKSPVDSEESGEHPEMLGGGSRARWGTEVLRCTVCVAVEPGGSKRGVMVADERPRVFK